MSAESKPFVRLQHVVRFGAVGVAQNLLNVATFAVLIAVGVPYLLAAVVAAVAAMTASFLANRRWTFTDAQDRPAGRQLTEYATIFGLASLGALGLLALFTEVVGIPKVASQTLALITMAPISFLAQRLITFRT